MLELAQIDYPAILDLLAQLATILSLLVSVYSLRPRPRQVLVRIVRRLTKIAPQRDRDQTRNE